MVLTFEIDRSKVLGRGAFAAVYAVEWNGCNVAVKRIQLHDLLTDREEETMRQLKHRNVVKLLAVEEDNDFKYLILELSLATVEDYCRMQYTGKMPTDPVALYQMADGLSYIHSKRLVHRDISTGNVLIAANGDDVVMKIADFGFAKPASATGSFSMSQGTKGTKRFVAPELLRQMDKKERGVNAETPRVNNTCDIFSLGCLFFVFLTKGSHPFSDGSVHTISINVLANNQFLEGLEQTHYALPLIKGMIQADPEERLCLDKVKESLMLHIN